MKARTMVYLDRDDVQALRAEAKRLRISLAELLRRIVREHLDARTGPPAPPRATYLKIVALGSSSRVDVAEHHDRYLAETLYREHVR